MKIISFKKEKLFHYSGRKTESTHCEKEIEIRPGYADNHEIRFEGEGHDVVGKHSGDLLVKLKCEKHGDFTRHGSHLIFTKKITFEDTMIPESFQITTLDDRILNVSINETISQETATVVRDEGMPILNLADPLVSMEKRNTKGDLIVKYEIEFPRSLSYDQKQKIGRILKE
jgi:DnaJ family protein B protein 4